MKLPHWILVACIVVMATALAVSATMLYRKNSATVSVAQPVVREQESGLPDGQRQEDNAVIGIPFFVDYLVGTSSTLGLADLPSTNHLDDGLRSVVLYKDTVFVKTDHGHVLELTRDGNTIAISDPNILKDCLNVELSVMGDRLFVACWGTGLYEVDLVSRQLKKIYTSTDGINPLNMRLVNDGTQLWIGTFEGVYRLDTTQGKIFVYRSEALKSNCPTSSAKVLAQQGDVWAVITAHGSCTGGVAHYLPASDSWKFFGSVDFGKEASTKGNRIDFDHFLFSKNDLIADYSDLDPKGQVLRKYDKVSDSWNVVADDTTPYQKEIRSAYLPANMRYGQVGTMDFVLDKPSLNEQSGEWLRVVFSNGVEALLPSKVYTAIAPNATGYWLMSDWGLQTFDPIRDRFPSTVSAAKISDRQFGIGTTSKIFTSENGRTAFVISVIENDFAGGSVRYNALAFGQPEFNTKLEKSFPGDVFSTMKNPYSTLSFEDLILNHQSNGNYVIADPRGFGFVINPINRTINVNKP